MRVVLTTAVQIIRRLSTMPGAREVAKEMSQSLGKLLKESAGTAVDQSDLKKALAGDKMSQQILHAFVSEDEVLLCLCLFLSVFVFVLVLALLFLFHFSFVFMCMFMHSFTFTFALFFVAICVNFHVHIFMFVVMLMFMLSVFVFMFVFMFISALFAEGWERPRTWFHCRWSVVHVLMFVFLFHACLHFRVHLYSLSHIDCPNNPQHKAGHSYGWQGPTGQSGSRFSAGTIKRSTVRDICIRGFSGIPEAAAAVPAYGSQAVHAEVLVVGLPAPHLCTPLCRFALPRSLCLRDLVTMASSLTNSHMQRRLVLGTGCEILLCCVSSTHAVWGNKESARKGWIPLTR